MTAARLISTETRSALLIALGTVLIAAPIVIGFGSALLATGIVTGAVMVGVGLAGTAATGRGTLPVSTHLALDRGLALGLIASGAIFGAAGNIAGLLLFGLAGLASVAITAITRYSARPAPQDFLQ